MTVARPVSGEFSVVTADSTLEQFEKDRILKKRYSLTAVVGLHRCLRIPSLASSGQLGTVCSS